MDDDSRQAQTIPIGYSQKTYKNKSDPNFGVDPELYRSNSANDLLDLKEKEKKNKIRSDSSKKKKTLQRTISAKTYFDHYDINNCEHCYGIDNMLKKDKSKLSDFIVNNSSFLKLFGNPRYDKSSPFLFVEDHKNRLDDDRIGLLPIPSKPRLIMKSKDENNRLYEIQRKVVMMRRFQYGKHNNNGEGYYDEDGEDFFEKIRKIQNWWKQMYKIIYIQKVFRGYRIRKRVNFILNFIDIMNKWQRLLDNIKARRALRDLVNKSPKALPNNNNYKGYDYMSKVRRTGKPFLNKDDDNNLDNNKKNNVNNDNLYKNYINNGNKFNNRNEDKKDNDDEKNNDSGNNKIYDKYTNGENYLKGLKDLSKISKVEPKKKVLLNKNGSFFTKIYYDKNVIDKINKIGHNVKDFLRNKNNLKKKNIIYDENNKEQNGLYIDKNYIPKYYKNVIDFNDLMKNALQKAYFRKRPNNDKKNEVDEDPDNKDKNGDNNGDNNNKNGVDEDPNNKDKNGNNDDNNKNKNLNEDDENKNIINPNNDFNFKNKNCYIEKIRKLKDNNNNNDKNGDDDGTKDNKNTDNNNKDNYNTNKSVNNQNDLYNMYLDVSEPKTVEYLNSEKKPKPLEFSISDNNNFSFNNVNPNKNKKEKEDKNEDKNKEDVSPMKKNKFKNDNCFISKENIKDVSKDLNKLQNKIKQFLNNKNKKEKNLKDKNNKNNYTIESKSTLNYLGNSKDKTDTSKDISKDTTNDDKKNKKQYIIDLKERFNFKGNSTNYNNNNMNNINRNDNLSIESNNWFNYPKDPNTKNKNISDNFVVDSNINVNYEGNDKNDDANNKNDLDELNKNLKEESTLNMNYKGNNKSKYPKKKRKLMIQKNSSFNYLRTDKEIINNNIDFNKNNLIIQSDYRFNYLSPLSDHQDISDNFVIQSEAGFDCPGIKKDKNKKKKKEKEEYLIDPNSKLNYIGNKENDDDYDDKNNLNNWNNNLNIDNHLNINYLRNSKNKDDDKNKNKNKNKNNLNNWNNNLNIGNNPSVNIIGKEKDKDKDNIKDLYIENNPPLTYEGNAPNNLRNKNKNTFNEDNLIGQPNINLNYEGVKPKSDDKKGEDDTNNKNMEELNKIQKIPEINKNLCYISKIRKELSSGKSYESRYNENLILKKDKSSKPENGLLITKLRLKNNLDKIKLIQDAIRKYLLNKDINNKEKIYKKPLFNQFYYYEDESPYEKRNKNKKKPKNGDENNKKKRNNKNKDDNDDKNLKKKNKNDENGDDDDDSDPNKKKNKNNNDNEEGNESGGSTVRYIKKNIPGKNMAEIYRLKPNHLLKIVKIQKGKSILEKLILSGTPKYLPPPPKKKGKDEDDIQNEYKSKTPNKVKRHKKYDDEDEDNKENDKNNKNKKNGGKNDINEELKNYLSKSHMDGIEDDELNDNENDGNMTDYEDDPLRKNRIKKLKNNMGNYFYMSKIRKGDIDDESIRKIQNKYKAFQNKDKDGNKTESDELNKDKDKVMPNIVKNNCYYDKVKISNDTHDKFLERANNLYKDKVYKISNNWKDSKSKDDDGKANYNNTKLDYITKQRHGNFNLNNNANKNQINELPINKNLCLITKERKINSVSLPNKNYKNSHHYITKERRTQNPNDNLNNNNLLLSTKNYSFKIMNNNNNCIITKERKARAKKLKGILLPRKEGIFISKIREKENMNQIKTIQNLFKKKNKNKDDKNKYLYNNEDQNAFIPRRKFYLKNLDDSDDTSEIEKDNYYLCGYYSKIYKRNIYKYYPAKNVRCYITKEKKKSDTKNEKNNKKNYTFLSLLDFFAKKNVQEYVFPKLFDNNNNNKSKMQDTSYNFDTNHNPIDDKLINNDENFTYPKYYKNLKRIYNFYKTKKRGESPKAKKIYGEIIPDIEQSKSLNDLITKLNADPSKNNKLINNLNKKKVNENDLINEMGEFAKYDKNLSNGGFIKNKLKEDENLKKNENNLFNLIKKVDDEYNNLINGKYCYKCGKELSKCKCDDINSLFKDTDESKDNFGDMNEIDDEDLDFNMGGDDTKKKRINYFEYDSNKSKGILIKGKPKLNDYLSSPMNNLVIYNQQQLNEINQRVKDKAKNSMNRFINTSNNNINDLQSNQSNSSNSGIRYNNRYSNYTNTNNYNNTSNLNNDSVNYNYNRNNINNNSISSGNNRNTYTYNNTQKSNRNNNENTSNRGYTYNRSNNNYNK